MKQAYRWTKQKPESDGTYHKRQGADDRNILPTLNSGMNSVSQMTKMSIRYYRKDDLKSITALDIHMHNEQIELDVPKETSPLSQLR